jgi:hypothetical protein
MSFIEIDSEFVPEQYISPEKALWERVLWQAILDSRIKIKDNCTKYEQNMKNIRDNARKWIKSRDMSAGSFVWICDLLSIDQAAAREDLISCFL